MLKILSVAALLLLPLPAAAEEVLIAGRIQKIILEPNGSDACPKPCPAMATTLPDGSTRICLQLGGGTCESVELKVERDYLGGRPEGSTWTERHRAGEFGQTFSTYGGLIVVYQNGARPSWTPAMQRDGQILVHPERFIGLGRAAKPEWFGADATGMVPVEQALDQLRVRR